MKFAVASEHRDFYHKNHLIEFNELLNPDQLADLNKQINEYLAPKLGIPVYKVKNASPEAQFNVGRDLWRVNDSLKRMILSPKLAEIASELIEQRPLRIGYDQLFPESKPLFDRFAVKENYLTYIQKHRSLHEVSCVRDIACGLMLCLAGPEQMPSEKPSIFSRTPGSGVFFNPELSVDFSEIEEYGDHRYLLIVYGLSSAVYALNQDDPHTHALKHLGYIFNDKLNDRLNPIVYR